MEPLTDSNSLVGIMKQGTMKSLSLDITKSHFETAIYPNSKRIQCLESSETKPCMETCKPCKDRNQECKSEIMYDNKENINSQQSIKIKEEPVFSIVNQKDLQISVTEKKRAISSMNPPLHSIVEILSKQLKCTESMRFQSLYNKKPTLIIPNHTYVNGNIEVFIRHNRKRPQNIPLHLFSL